MAITLMTTTGTLPDVQAALGIAAGSAPAPETESGPITASVETFPPAKPAETDETPADRETPPVEATPPDATTAVADAEVPDSEFDEDGEPTTERAARSSRTKLQTIRKLRLRAREAELRAARAEGELEARRALQTPVTPPPVEEVAPAPPAAPDPNEPKEVDYATYESFIEARADYRARKAVREELEQRQRADTESRQRQAVAERIKAFEADHPDYRELVSNPDLQLTPPIAYALQTSEDGPAMAYALAKDVDRYKRIAAMDPAGTFQALGELRAELRMAAQSKPAEAPPLPKPPTAPPPPTPVRGGSVAASVTLEEFAKTIHPGDGKASEWIRRRNEQLARQGQR